VEKKVELFHGQLFLHVQSSKFGSIYSGTGNTCSQRKKKKEEEEEEEGEGRVGGREYPVPPKSTATRRERQNIQHGYHAFCANPPHRGL
jgi:hypothetical protein